MLELDLTMGTNAAGSRFRRMRLRAQECRARASEARELAPQVKKASRKAALEQAAEYWSALAERVEQSEGKQPGRTALHLPRPSESHSDAMPIFGYLLSVGIALFLGLLAVSAQLDTRAPDAAAVSTAQSSAALFSTKSY